MVRITADSVADLEQMFVTEKIDVMPLNVILEGVVYLDGVTIKPQEIFQAYAEKKVLPKTAARSIEDYKEFFQKNQCAEGIVHFCISEELSSSYSNALIAAKEFENVFVVDSRTLSTGIGLLVLKANDFAKAGRAAKDIYDAILQLVPHVQASFVVDTMEYLHKGGRCTAITRYLAAAFRIKPMIMLKDGGMVVGQKYMGGFNKNILKYVENILNKYNTPDYSRIFVTHTYSEPEVVEAVKAKIRELAPQFETIIETHAGCTVTAHCGKNTLGILYINQP